jgi:hypothetical protein
MIGYFCALRLYLTKINESKCSFLVSGRGIAKFLIPITQCRKTPSVLPESTRCGQQRRHGKTSLFALRIDDLDFKAGTIRVDESADQRTYIIGPCKNVAAYRTVLMADAEGREALSMLKRFLKGTQTSFVFRSKRGTALCETCVLHRFLHPVLKTLGFPQAEMHVFRHGCNRR